MIMYLGKIENFQCISTYMRFHLFHFMKGPWEKKEPLEVEILKSAKAMMHIKFTEYSVGDHISICLVLFKPQNKTESWVDHL